MAKRKYCDPKRLKAVWWAWILSRRTPDLEVVRDSGQLWTKDEGNNNSLHFVASSSPFEFKSSDGQIPEDILVQAIKASFRPSNPVLVRNLAESNFYHEMPSSESWDILSEKIYRMCSGIALNFRPPSEDVKNELIHEAVAQTLSKIQRGKLQFDLGKAPPFNLLTTAIFRIMFSIKNKEKRGREHRTKLTNAIMSGATLPSFNSLNVSKSLIGLCH